MADKNELSLSTKELVQLLFQTGNRRKAKEISKRYLQKEKSKPEINGIDIQNYSPAENEIIQYLGESQYSIIFENDSKTLIIHSIKLDKILTEVVEDNHHTFSIMDWGEDLYKSIISFYHLEDTSKVDLYETAIAMDVINYDLIQDMNKEELKEFIHNNSNKTSVKNFLEDFSTNNQEINPIVFTKRGRVVSMEFFVPSTKCIWMIDYTNVKADEIIIQSLGAESYFEIIEDLIKKAFTDFEDEMNKLNDKFFSLKRGFPFFIKSNIVLVIIMLAIYINRNSWVYDGRDFYELFGFFSEVLILFITLIACFRPKSVKWKTTKQNQKNKGNVGINKT